MRVDIDQRGIRKLVRAPELYDQMLLHAQRAEMVARSLGPKGRTSRYTGKMFARKMTNAWASAAYGTDDFKGWWMEWGTKTPSGGVRTPAHHVLQKAGRAVGMRVGQLSQPGKSRLADI